MIAGLAAEYNYLCDSECTIAGVDDGRAYEETASALSTLGFSQSDITDIFSILASVLHLGNIYFEHGSHGDDSSSIRVLFFKSLYYHKMLNSIFCLNMI